MRYKDSFSVSLSSQNRSAAGCYLVIFDRRPDAQQLPWSERIKWEEEGGVIVLGC
ncbi:hypothetical protein FACS1894199_19050 [Bacteroidia bacterium]|nr:hypothetical protein FACS1894199_19050 [Bacteroidia bacterium]